MYLSFISVSPCKLTLLSLYTDAMCFLTHIVENIATIYSYAHSSVKIPKVSKTGFYFFFPLLISGKESWPVGMSTNARWQQFQHKSCQCIRILGERGLEKFWTDPIHAYFIIFNIFSWKNNVIFLIISRNRWSWCEDMENNAIMLRTDMFIGIMFYLRHYSKYFTCKSSFKPYKKLMKKA